MSQKKRNHLLLSILLILIGLTIGIIDARALIRPGQSQTIIISLPEQTESLLPRAKVSSGMFTVEIAKEELLQKAKTIPGTIVTYEGTRDPADFIKLIYWLPTDKKVYWATESLKTKWSDTDPTLHNISSFQYFQTVSQIRTEGKDKLVIMAAFAPSVFLTGAVLSVLLLFVGVVITIPVEQ